ncbi:hypothetical protein E2C01_048799 [Portunus trituberculatus]|uniref:Uncharacterized protein n=1 Tax=Portunus trituberculatus TaxID=210409 RepID=A0A5B7G410_PORTR|nr:hypothetical protein [Portunus trituberculatus]
MPSMVRIILHTRQLFAERTAWYIRHGGGNKVAVTSTGTVRVVNSISAPTWALPLLLNGSRVVLQPAPKRVTSFGKAFPLKKDHQKKAAKLVGVGRLVSLKSTQQLVVRSSKAYLMGKAGRGVIC